MKKCFDDRIKMALHGTILFGKSKTIISRSYYLIIVKILTQRARLWVKPGGHGLLAPWQPICKTNINTISGLVILNSSPTVLYLRSGLRPF